MSRKALGKGIDALLPEEKGRLIQIEIDSIKYNPYQPRKSMGSLDELVLSIKENGVIEPIIVRTIDEGYEVICGERRVQAAKQLGMDYIPAVVREASDREMLELALIENLQRENLNPLEAAEAFTILIKSFGLSHQEIAKRVSKDRATVTNTLRLLGLEEEIKELIWNGKLSEGHARAILSLKPGKNRIKVAKRIAELGLTVRETEKITKKRTSLYPDLENILTQYIGNPVIIVEGRNKGRISVEYYGEDDLMRIVGLFRDITYKVE
ncbi:ParB/RepB/Spo0J family partition protein [candidate division WOR-3 bacterium]|nr:ParB/RepB/Spo0J family partition protein [candidate division WOR-3 bacterium]